MLSFTEANNISEFRINEDVLIHFDFSFNHVIAALNSLDSSELNDVDKINHCWDFLIQETEYTSNVNIRSKIIEEALNRIQSSSAYQRRGVRTVEGDVFVPPMTVKNDDNLPKYDFEQDAGAIYASFLMQYQIDLFEEIDKLSWFKFTTLFEHLGSETPIKKIMSIRSDAASNYSEEPEKAQQVEEQKDYYHLEIADRLEAQRTLEANGGELFGNFFKK